MSQPDYHDLLDPSVTKYPRPQLMGPGNDLVVFYSHIHSSAPDHPEIQWCFDQLPPGHIATRGAQSEWYARFDKPRQATVFAKKLKANPQLKHFQVVHVGPLPGEEDPPDVMRNTVAILNIQDLLDPLRPLFRGVTLQFGWGYSVPGVYHLLCYEKFGRDEILSRAINQKYPDFLIRECSREQTLAIMELWIERRP